MVALGCQGRYKGHWWFDCLVFRNPDARERSSVRYPGDPSGRYADGLRRCSVQAADHSPLATESRGAVRGAIAALWFLGASGGEVTCCVVEVEGEKTWAWAWTLRRTGGRVGTGSIDDMGAGAGLGNVSCERSVSYGLSGIRRGACPVVAGCEDCKNAPRHWDDDASINLIVGQQA